MRVFLSYTTREEEVLWIQPLVDAYCRGLWEWASHRGVDVFYDHFSLEQRSRSEEELRAVLFDHVDAAHLFVAFLSPGYVESTWCRFEALTFARRRPITESSVHPVYWKPNIYEEGWRENDVDSDNPDWDVRALMRNFVERFRIHDVTQCHSPIAQAREAVGYVTEMLDNPRASPISVRLPGTVVYLDETTTADLVKHSSESGRSTKDIVNLAVSDYLNREWKG